jgi:hypothetical protein
MGKAPRSRFGLVGTAGRVGPLELSTCRSGSLGRSRFVRTLFNPHGSTGLASGIPTLPVVPGLAAVADRAASRLPKSPLTNVSIRHTGSLVRAGDLVFHRIKRFLRAADGPSTLCRSGRGHPPSSTWEMWMAPNAPSSALAVPQPSIHLSWPVALNAIGPIVPAGSGLQCVSPPSAVIGTPYCWNKGRGGVLTGPFWSIKIIAVNSSLEAGTVEG